MTRLLVISALVTACSIIACTSPDEHDAGLRSPPNVLLICVDDLRPELGCYGVDYIDSPNIDRLAREGMAFTRHYVQAPTCGASRYALLTGSYSVAGASRGNDALVARAKDVARSSPTLPEVFRAAGYETVSVGKVSHYPGGRYGAAWDQADAIEMPEAWTRHYMPTGAWGTPQGAMHALANGQVRMRGVTPPYESFDGPDDAYPDGLVAESALAELDRLARSSAPFFLAVGFIRPHLPFGAPARYMRPYADVELPPIPHPERPPGRTTWHGSGEFGQYAHANRDARRDSAYAEQVRKHYAACVTYVDTLVGRLLERLDDLELRDETIVVLWGDHGWHLGEHGIWGKHSLFEESLRSPLIVSPPQLEQRGQRSAAVVESVDIFPTLCHLSGLSCPEGLDGRSLVPQLDEPATPGRPAISYQSGAETIRSERHRLVRHARDGETTHVELYDHASPAAETQNRAGDEPALVDTLLEELARRLR